MNKRFLQRKLMVASLAATSFFLAAHASAWTLKEAAAPYSGTTLHAIFLDRPGYAAAEMVLLPALTPLASPAELMVATAVFEEVHVTWLVMFCVLLFEYVPVAVNCCVAPA